MKRISRTAVSFCFPDNSKFERMSCKKNPDAGASGLNDVLHLFSRHVSRQPTDLFRQTRGRHHKRIGCRGRSGNQESF